MLLCKYCYIKSGRPSISSAVFIYYFKLFKGSVGLTGICCLCNHLYFGTYILLAGSICLIQIQTPRYHMRLLARLVQTPRSQNCCHFHCPLQYSHLSKLLSQKLSDMLATIQTLWKIETCLLSWDSMSKLNVI